MSRYATIFIGKDGVFFENVISENPVLKGQEIFTRGKNHVVKTAVLAESQTPHIGDIIAKRPRTRRATK